MIIRSTRRSLLRYGSASALATLASPAIAQAWPAKPIKFVVTYPPGGLTDVFARAYGEYVSQKVGQPVVVENKAGAAGAIGAELVKGSPADGYTLMFTNSTTMMQNKVLFKKLPYDPNKDFVLVAWFNTGHLPTAVNKDVPVKNINEFAAWARDRKVSAATYGAGSYAHVVAESLNKHFNLKMEPVHYRGESAMWPDVVSGAVQIASGSYAAMSPFLQSGAIKVIAVPTMERMKKLADVPTYYEQGLTAKAFQVRGWVGCAAPVGTPDAIVQRLSDLMVEAGKTERIQKILDTFGIDQAAQDRHFFKKVIDDEEPTWLEVIRSLNLEPQ
jgi:tripartite-type tricarboxylate transporter receptor subunit TctC